MACTNIPIALRMGMLYTWFSAQRAQSKPYSAARERLAVNEGGLLHRWSQGKSLKRFQIWWQRGRRGFYRIHFKNGFVQMTWEAMGSTPKPHQKIDVYVQYPCSTSPCSYSIHPSPQTHSILKLFCYVVRIISYDRSPARARVCVSLWGLRLQASHIISAKYSILAGTLQI